MADVIKIGMIPNEESHTLDIVALNETKDLVATIGYICSEGTLHLIADEEIANMGLNIDEDGYIRVCYNDEDFNVDNEDLN